MIRIGTVIEINGDKALIYTMDSEYVYIRRPGVIVGEQLSFSKKELYDRVREFRPKTKRLITAVSVFMVIVLLLTLTGSFKAIISGIFRSTEAVAFIDVDINPSLELQIDKDNVILSADSFNVSGKAIVGKLILKGMQLRDGIKLIVTTAKSMGYMTSDRSIVLMSGMINVKNSAVAGAKAAYEIKLKSLLTTIQTEADYVELLSVFIDNAVLRKDAAANNISVNRQMIYQYSKGNDSGLTLDQVRDGSISEILSKVNGILKGALNQEIFTAATISSTTAAKTTPTLIATPASSTVMRSSVLASFTPPPEPPAATVTAKAITTVAATQTPVAQFVPALRTSTSGKILVFAWNPVTASSVNYNGSSYTGFKYYKVVASTSPHPKYPENGYLAVISDAWASDWSVDPSSVDYSHNPELISGGQYYISITYVFENGMIYSDDVFVTVPQYTVITPVPTGFIGPAMNVTVSGKSLLFTWNPVRGSKVTVNGVNYTGFQYYKIVASTSPSPKYPEDGYLKAVSGVNEDQWTLNPSTDSYNRNPKLISGTKYYFSVTYVFSNGKLYANDIQVTVP